MRRMKVRNLRALVATFVVLAVAIGYVTVTGLGNVCAAGVGLVSSICPVGALSALLASKTLIPRTLVALAVVAVLILIFGRAFCAWICPIPLVQRWLPDHRRRAQELEVETKSVIETVSRSTSEDTDADARTGGKRIEDEKGSCASCGEGTTCTAGAKMKLDSRHLILGGTLLSAAVFGFPVFCLVCPIGLTFATLLLVMRLFAFGETTWTLLVFPVILILELVVFRTWCRRICPLGALMSLIAGASKTFRPHIDDERCLVTSKGSLCRICAKACPEGIDVRHPDLSRHGVNECSKCLECVDACPVHAISLPPVPSRK